MNLRSFSVKTSVVSLSILLLLGGSSGAFAGEKSEQKSKETIISIKKSATPDPNAEIIEIPEQYESIIASGLPVTVTVDAGSGEVESVGETPSMGVLAAGVRMNDCSNSRPCWYGYYSPDAFYGYEGTGTVYGNWPRRGDFYSSNREASICWYSADRGGNSCSWRMAQYTTWRFTGVGGDGRSVTLY